MTKISAVVFDVGNVLFRWDLRHLFEKLIEEREELDWFLANVVTPEWHFEHDAGKPLAQMRAELTQLFPDYAPHIEAYTKRFNETIPGPVPGSLEIVEELAERGVPLFAITNFGAEFWEGFYSTQPVFRHFRDIVVSGREKLVKPDPAIYKLACQRFGIVNGQAIFVDDNLANIASARNFGFRVHHFIDAVDLRKTLQSLDLLSG